ncbi:MAG TPA: hypothetical protein VFC77_06960, partial [Myxococcota bacterium]|nr:hypothetical protein [Myxococcota bacterium]
MSEILIQNARSHNLRDVSCRIPLRSLTVITGVSGSGKSTLAFDTLYAEGQRRYVTSLSTYARQFLERLPRPEVDFISNLPPAIAIERRNRVTNARSTVGTATEIHDHLRLLLAQAGEVRCPDCDLPALPGTVEAVAARIVARFAGRRVAVGAPLRAPGDADPAEWRAGLLREGWGRLLGADGTVLDLAELDARALARLARAARGPRDATGALLLVDRIAVRPEAAARVVEAVAAAFARGGELFAVVAEDGERARHRAAQLGPQVVLAGDRLAEVGDDGTHERGHTGLERGEGVVVEQATGAAQSDEDRLPDGQLPFGAEAFDEL